MLGQVVQAQIEYVRRYDEQGPWRQPGLNDDTPQAGRSRLGRLARQGAEDRWNPHHYFEWRNYSAYSGGICTDLFIHRITRIMKACELLYPRRVVGMGGIWQWPDGRDLPDNFEMICEYPRGMTVYVLGTMSNRVGVDHLIRGYRGTLYFTGYRLGRQGQGRQGARQAQEDGRRGHPSCTTRTCTTICATASR